jgi:hypothetical protein
MEQSRYVDRQIGVKEDKKERNKVRARKIERKGRGRGERREEEASLIA